MLRAKASLSGYRKLRAFLRDDYELLKALLNNDYEAHEMFHRREFFRRAFAALSFNEIAGDYAEFGAGNTSFPLAYAESRRAHYPCHLWAFDSFQGLPKPQFPDDKHPKWVENWLNISLEQFKNMCRLNGIPNQDYDVVPGWFKDTIGAEHFDLNLPRNVSLAYVDCDLYSSTKVVLKFLGKMLRHGMIIAFDDYYCWSKDTIAGERKASLEFFSSNKQFALLPYHQYGWGGMSFIVEDKRLNKDEPDQ